MRTNGLEVSDKQLVEQLLNGMPDDVSLGDIAQELEFIVAVREGLSEFDENKDSISIERVEPKLPSWSVTVGRKRRGRTRQKTQRAKEARNQNTGNADVRKTKSR